MSGQPSGYNAYDDDWQWDVIWTKALKGGLFRNIDWKEYELAYGEVEGTETRGAEQGELLPF